MLSLHAGYRLNERLRLTAKVDNLLDKNYAGAPEPPATPALATPGGVRINEPGRTLRCART